MLTEAPTAIAPARNARSTLRLASIMASSVRPRTKVSMRTSAGTALTASPPVVMMGCTRIVSLSMKVSRLKWMAVRASVAAFSALMPRCGEPPACAPLPTNWIFFARVPLLVPLRHNCRSLGVLVVCSIIARCTSSNSPSLMNSGFPPKNSILPSRRRPSRYSISMYSSAGTAMVTMRPLKCGSTSGCINPIVAPRAIPIWQWCPQACAAPVVRISVGVLIDDQTIQLANNGHRRAFAPANHLSAQTGHAQSAAEWHSHLGELITHQPRRFELSESWLRIGQNLFR